MSAIEPCDIAYYAFGGGMGHVTRAAAILRHVIRLSPLRPFAITNAEVLLPLVTEGIPFLHVAESEPGALAERLCAALDRLRPRLLVVDVFAHGVVGELAGVPAPRTCAKALVCRHLRRPYADRLAAEASGFDLALCVERPMPQLPIPTVDCGPVLLRDADEVASRTAARSVLGVDPDRCALVAVSTEGAQYTSRLFSLVARLTAGFAPPPALFWASPSLEQFAPTGSFAGGVGLDHYPLLELLNGVDVLVGASGYNLFTEAAALGVPAVFIPQERRYDDQHLRAREAMVASDPAGLGALLRSLVAARPPRPERARFVNGASRAAAELVRLARTHPLAEAGGAP